MNPNEFVALLQSVNCDGKKLESGLTVGGCLDLSETNITSLPDGLTKDWHVLTLFDEKARRIVSQKIIFRGGTR